MHMTSLNICRTDMDAYQQYDGKTSQRAMEKQVPGINQKQRHQKQTRIIYVEEHVELLKSSWAEHATGQTDLRWTKRILQLKPWAKRRNVCRPQTRWIDDLKRLVDLVW